MRKKVAREHDILDISTSACILDGTGCITNVALSPQGSIGPKNIIHAIYSTDRSCFI